MNDNKERKHAEPEGIPDTSADEIFYHHHVLNSLVDGVILLDSTNRISFINNSLKNTLHLNNSVVGLTIMEAIRSQELNDLVDRIRREGSVVGYEYEEHGLQDRFFRINGSLSESMAGQSPVATLVFHDLTLSRQYERQRQDFVANVSHELRTPLSMISGYVETLISGAKDNPETLEKFLQIIEKHTNRLTWLIEDLLTISSLESGGITLSLQSRDANKAVQQVIDELEEKAAHRKITFEVDISESLTLHADIGRLHQILVNLVDNAIKYGQPNSTIKIVVAPQPAGKFLLFSVNNQGPVIPLDVRDRIFERFFRIDAARSREQGGTGLGLAIVKHLVQLHDGQVQIDSSHLNGTTFSFTLPILP